MWISWGKVGKVLSKGIGSVLLKFNNTGISLLIYNCLYVPEIDINSVSVRCLNSEKISVLFEKYVATLFKKPSNKIISKVFGIEKLYQLPI
jgi:hypothetical protein